MLDWYHMGWSIIIHLDLGVPVVWFSTTFTFLLKYIYRIQQVFSKEVRAAQTNKNYLKCNWYSFCTGLHFRYSTVHQIFQIQLRMPLDRRNWQPVYFTKGVIILKYQYGTTWLKTLSISNSGLHIPPFFYEQPNKIYFMIS